MEHKMSDLQNIQWFPGHMAKTRRKITESLSLVDAVAEIVDARIPVSSRNPELAGIIHNKPRIILLNKSDMADAKATAEWISLFGSLGIKAIPVDCKSGKGLRAFEATVKDLLAERIEFYKKKGMKKSLRIMVVGIPNVGKSSFINHMAGSKRAKVEDRPGVTRGNQWFSVSSELELLDTPGVLWPKFDDPLVGVRLAFTGAVKDEVLDIETLAVELLDCLSHNYPELIEERYRITCAGKEPYELLSDIGRGRGMVIRGGEINTERAAIMLLDEFREGKIGRITLELPINATDQECL